MKNILWIMLFGAGCAFAQNDVVVDSSADQINKELSAEIKSQRITKEQAEEMELNRAESYEVVSTVSVDNLEMQIAEKLKDSIMPYYSIEFNDPTSNDESFVATVTEYFGKVE
ncbi:hypothetical protein ACQKPX_07070 [Photobacterium sp. DNB23_23_1]|uniref:DUF3316 domain-containing protein n=1 Tax=Photobacterium pectinilyticum TaxID=2906793 RepID=A0ABT1N278_9GAMM|nr:hypothetical protein [Photobacterium sp. ZSDE20]MCQ1058212.1 hypothetical protein [Photobacterium sp. ZSDE20]MDD1822935.1 hypothetical protein [Photobacterium sp. ZSDE20]